MSEFKFELNRKRDGTYLCIIAAIYAVLFIIVNVIGDTETTLAINQWTATFPAWGISLLRTYTKYGYYFFGIPVIGIAVLTYFTNKLDRLQPYRMMFLGLAFGYVTSWFLTAYIFKPTFARTRPYLADSRFDDFDVHSQGCSFPSGHATASFSMAVPLMVRVKHILLRVFFYAYAITLAFSRCMVGVHYMNDVLVGSIVGTACSLVFYALFETLNKKGKLTEKNQKILLVIALIIALVSIVLDILDLPDACFI